MTITDAQIVYVFIIPSLATESTRVMETYIWYLEIHVFIFILFLCLGLIF